MKLYTTNIHGWRKAKHDGIPFLDTTVKSGDRTFAPTWPLVSRYKAKLITEDEYTERYYELMRESYRSNKDYWIKTLKQPELAIACYCTSGDFCHRLLLVNIFEKVCNDSGIPFTYEGEL